MAEARRDPWLALGVAALAAGALFFFALDSLWPLARIDPAADRDALAAQARSFLTARGFDLAGFDAAVALRLDGAAVDYLERAGGREEVQQRISAGSSLASYVATFKRRGEPTVYTVDLHPDTGLIGWSARLEDDAGGARLDEASARWLAHAAARDALDLDLDRYEPRAASSIERSARRDHRFVYELVLRENPEIRERVTLSVDGDLVSSVRREFVVPPAARRATRSAAAPAIALESIGFALLAAAAGAAFVVFLRGLREGTVRLGRAAVWPGVVFVALLGTFALETPTLFAFWDPLWPFAVSASRYLVERAMELAWLVVVLLAVVAAADALDRQSGACRGESLWRLGRGAWTERAVGLASLRGFLVGLICGGALTAAVLLLERFAGATVALQPRGFFFFTLNSAFPAASSLLFFAAVALAEESGYRFFGATWLLRLTGRRWVSVLVPALIYGLTHTRLDFLPPTEPFWGRAVALTAVGCVWGWAFLRYDALTVVLSHYTADLFIFNWPALAGGGRSEVALALVAVAFPLLPAAGAFARGTLGRRARHDADA